MKASEFIKELQAAIDSHGDLEVMTWCERAAGLVEVVDVYPDTHKGKKVFQV